MFSEARLDWTVRSQLRRGRPDGATDRKPAIQANTIAAYIIHCFRYFLLQNGWTTFR